MIEILEDALIDTIKLIPFLLITYIIMEYVEHKTSSKAKKTIQNAGKLGPLIGGVVGIFPQCGFSASATNLYATRIISIGTLIAVYLSTSDEMLPIFISEAVPLHTIIKIIAIKLVIGIFWGFVIDFIFHLKNNQKQEPNTIIDICEHEHCHCNEKGIVKSAIFHTVTITIYIFIVTLIINLLIALIGEETIEHFIQNNLYLGPVVASLIGLIPNCAASVIITNLYITNVINVASLIAGLLTGAGVGLIVLFRINKGHLKENLMITGSIYLIGVISGWILQFIGLVI